MTLTVEIAQALRAMPRRYKVLFVLAAAWAPILFARSPLLACGVIVVATALFWVSVSNRVLSPCASKSGTPDAEP